MELLWPIAGLILLVLFMFLAERRWPEGVSRLEENVIAILLASITLISFAQVIARYGFNSGWSGSLEATRVLFAWLILFGMAYGVKTGIHLGVDALIRLFPRPLFKAAALFGALCTFAYAVILLHGGVLIIFGADMGGNWRQSGAIGYWTFMYDRGTGLDDLRYPEIMQSTFGLQERVQRWVAYIMLPVGLALLAFRSLQAVVQIAKGQRELIVAGHEAENLVAENANVVKD
ncbi:TRAP transporter small permease [Fulvimarina sp. 2208YS6-2-32]|uniref:TRAP transporter small permease protein n=1 Tax=Fulvimarina uroteuthidis TaxID=3098149 RepID=A0ABU5I3L4_9HYPH|nr:TRAP transporter small permease [Fulvimarina sp. 2208YS6-2-32]MDY8109964.1 TRAP transporter small permease [Fulvimarina sp. 2208YS6-2-32]